MNRHLSQSELWQRLSRLASWIERNNYRGYEPFDALLSPLRPIAFRRPYMERLLIQAVRQCPVNLRPLLGIEPHESSMGRGCMASGYLSLYRFTGSPEYLEKANVCLEWLIRNKSPFFEEYTWGHHFDWVSRAGPHPMYMPTIVWTSLIGHSFLDAYELTGKSIYSEVVAAICRWILALPRERTLNGTCISYVSFRQDSIHNSNMLGASILARYGALNGDRECIDTAGEAMLYSCERQLPNGAWYYGESPMHRWIDNFHTAYNLDSLKCYLEYTNSDLFKKNLQNGYRYYRETFFEADGCPRYYDRRTYPIDIQCASQSITTLSIFADYEETSLEQAHRVARWTINHMQDESGYFYYRKLPGITVKTPMFHWGQATMFKALTHLYSTSYTRGSEADILPLSTGDKGRC
ncbi:MAG: hypothetical protein GXX84_16900 [Acidobacteria bacterium]|nr:hypothetical protein [Acidobacteriota bacterium]